MRSVFQHFRFVLVSFLLVLTSLSVSTAQEEKPLFTFGVIADVQFADVESSGKRDYRGSPNRLDKAVEIFNAHDLAFIVHCGDLIDRYYESFDIPLTIFRKSAAPIHYVVGNHEFSVADSLKRHVRGRINNPKGYYSFVVKGFQFVLIDAMDVSVHSSVKGSSEYRKALEMQKSLKERNANNAYDWNGALGTQQLRWLKGVLRSGERKGYKTIIFSHHPLLPENGLQAWNSKTVVELISMFPSVIAVISGHHHEGGYVKEGDVHHLTLKGLVEATSETACAVAEVYAGKVIIKGFGDQKSYVLDYKSAGSLSR
jgi:predicted phosphodiesterase